MPPNPDPDKPTDPRPHSIGESSMVSFAIGLESRLGEPGMGGLALIPHDEDYPVRGGTGLQNTGP